MKKLLVGVAVVGVFASGIAAGQSLLGPKGRFTASFLTRLEYDPSAGCTKPFRPYTDDDFANQMYISSAKEYLRCLDTASKSDAEYALEVVAAGREKALRDFLKELKR